MRHSEVIYLQTVTVTKDELFNDIEAITERLVYANEYRVTDRAYYEAAGTGLKIQKKFEIYSFEYEGEERLKHNNKLYRISRVDRNGEKTIITCGEVLADG